MNLQSKLKSLRKQRKITQEELASAIGVERSSIGKYETGTNPSTEILKLIADYFNVTVDYLLGRTEQTTSFPQFDNIFPINKKRLPLLGEIACGQPIFTNEDRESYVEIGTDVHADFCLRAKGDSMTGARIEDGDIVFIQSQSTVNNGEIAAIVINDEATLKRVHYHPERNMLILKAENSKYEDIIFLNEELDHIHILGKAVAFQSDVR